MSKVVNFFFKLLYLLFPRSREILFYKLSQLSVSISFDQESILELLDDISNGLRYNLLDTLEPRCHQDSVGLKLAAQFL